MLIDVGPNYKKMFSFFLRVKNNFYNKTKQIQVVQLQKVNDIIAANKFKANFTKQSTCIILLYLASFYCILFLKSLHSIYNIQDTIL
jgi:hypothetical protein